MLWIRIRIRIRIYMFLDLPDPLIFVGSVADPGCLSRISDPRSQNSNKREGWKKICCHTFLCNHKFHKIENYFIFEVLKKKIWANFQRIVEPCTQRIVTKLSKICDWDPGSWSRGQKGTGSRIRIRNTVCRDPDPASPISSKNSKKNIDSLWVFIFEEWYKCTFKK